MTKLKLIFYLQIQDTRDRNGCNFSNPFTLYYQWAIIKQNYMLFSLYSLYSLFQSLTIWNNTGKDFQLITNFNFLTLIKQNELLDALNNISPAIQFTMEANVSFKSNHPKHCSDNIPFSLCHRIYMITEKDSLI